ncbi:hypothetical protein EVG20_g8646 [Dentipellis fragilis]|uniref:Uncharacterized protein n=1 Tax=Dentipellis fragilis TaxID=205917 RepID=A0A4Y9Y4Q9_9AGAM|nr:hypothetical protein EVG20_g8646 [Dentipellis fragilis]
MHAPCALIAPIIPIAFPTSAMPPHHDWCISVPTLIPASASSLIGDQRSPSCLLRTRLSRHSRPEHVGGLHPHAAIAPSSHSARLRCAQRAPRLTSITCPNCGQRATITLMRSVCANALVTAKMSPCIQRSPIAVSASVACGARTPIVTTSTLAVFSIFLSPLARLRHPFIAQRTAGLSSAPSSRQACTFVVSTSLSLPVWPRGV